MKRFLALSLLALLSIPVAYSAEVQQAANFALRYDLDSATYVYPRIIGQNGSPFGGSMAGPGTIKTTGSSTTVEENVASSNPFTDITVGDIIIVARSTTNIDIVVVTAKASAASITVDTAVNWSAGYAWRWLDFQVGAAATDGWISVSGWSSYGITVQYDQGDLDALAVRWECKGSYPGAQPVVVYPGPSSDCGGGTLGTGECEFATPGITSRISIVDDAPIYSQCRVAIRYKTADASDAGANIEQVTIGIEVGKYAR